MENFPLESLWIEILSLISVLNSSVNQSNPINQTSFLSAVSELKKLKVRVS
jgi:hypothetical protein